MSGPLLFATKKSLKLAAQGNQAAIAHNALVASLNVVKAQTGKVISAAQLKSGQGIPAHVLQAAKAAGAATVPASAAQPQAQPPMELFDPGSPATIAGPDVGQLTGGALASITTDGLPKTGNLAVAPMFSNAGQGMRFTDDAIGLEDGTESPVETSTTPTWLVPAAMIVGLVLLWRQS